MGRSIGFLAASAAVCFAACGHPSGGAGDQAQTAQVGRRAPNWSQPTLDGRRIAMESLRGKPVYLNFFATWCHGCNEEAEALDLVSRQYRDRGLQVVGVDVLESPRKAAEFRSQHHLSFPLVLDQGTLREQYQINALPVQVFIDRSGTVRRIVLGQISLTEMRANVERLLQ
ncbi:MAG: TlpA family protein disulfide reductase [Candidatus Eremiobacteraeota bacterium]|nr:TlpA family protein disulfide reductase [Candidatus Eremiobacteraeota bacterium]